MFDGGTESSEKAGVPQGPVATLLHHHHNTCHSVPLKLPPSAAYIGTVNFHPVGQELEPFTREEVKAHARCLSQVHKRNLGLSRMKPGFDLCLGAPWRMCYYGPDRTTCL